MPIYTFYNNKTKETSDIEMSMAEHDTFSLNPEYPQVPVALNLHSGGGINGRKIDDGFNDILKNIKKKHSGGYKVGRSTINTK